MSEQMRREAAERFALELQDYDPGPEEHGCESPEDEESTISTYRKLWHGYRGERSPCDPLESCTYARRPVQDRKMEPASRRAWERAVALAWSRRSTDHQLPAIVDALTPAAVVPPTIGTDSIVVVDLMGAVFSAALGLVADEVREICSSVAKPQLLAVPITSVLGAFPSEDPCSVALELIGRFEAASKHMIILGTHTDASRLQRKRLPLEVIPLSAVSLPTFLGPLTPEPCVPREEAEVIRDLLSQGRNVAVIGPPGSGKTVVCRSIGSFREFLDRSLEMSVSAYVGGTIFRGQSEERTAELFSIGDPDRPPLVYIDEIPLLGQRTHQDGSVTDSPLDQWNTDLASPRPPLQILCSCTAQEWSEICVARPSVARRFSTVFLGEPSRATREKIVGFHAERKGFSDPHRARDEAVRLAPHVVREASPAAEVKLLSWADSDRKSILPGLRNHLGELVAPRHGKLARGLTHLERTAPGRSEAIRSIRDTIDAALRGLVVGGEDGPAAFCAAVLFGPRGSGKGWFAGQLAHALGVKRVHRATADPASLRAFVATHRSTPGGALIISGNAGAPVAATSVTQGDEETGDGLSLNSAIHVVSDLSRWLIVATINVSEPLGDATPCAMDGPLPVAWVPMTPVTLRPSEALAVGRELLGDIRRRATSLGIVRRVPRIGESELRALCTGATPHEIERRLARRVLGEKQVGSEPAPPPTSGMVLPFDRTRIVEA